MFSLQSQNFTGKFFCFTWEEEDKRSKSIVLLNKEEVSYGQAVNFQEPVRRKTELQRSSGRVRLMHTTPMYCRFLYYYKNA